MAGETNDVTIDSMIIEKLLNNEITREEALRMSSEVDRKKTDTKEEDAHVDIYKACLVADPDYAAEQALADVQNDKKIPRSDAAAVRVEMYEKAVDCSKLAADNAITMIQKDKILGKELSDKAERNVIKAAMVSGENSLDATVKLVTTSTAFKNKEKDVEAVIDLAKEKGLISVHQHITYIENINQITDAGTVNIVDTQDGSSGTINNNTNPLTRDPVNPGQPNNNGEQTVNIDNGGVNITYPPFATGGGTPAPQQPVPHVPNNPVPIDNGGVQINVPQYGQGSGGFVNTSSTNSGGSGASGSGGHEYTRNIVDTGQPTQYIGRQFSDGRADITGGIVDRPTNVPDFMSWQASLGLGLYPNGNINYSSAPPSGSRETWGVNSVEGRYGITPQDMFMIIHTPISSGAGIQTNPDGSYQYFGNAEAIKRQVAEAYAPGDPEMQQRIINDIVDISQYNSPHFAVGQKWFDIFNEDVHGITPGSNPGAFQGTTTYVQGSGKGAAGLDIYALTGQRIPPSILEAAPHLQDRWAAIVADRFGGDPAILAAGGPGGTTPFGGVAPISLNGITKTAENGSTVTESRLVANAPEVAPRPNDPNPGVELNPTTADAAATTKTGSDVNAPNTPLHRTTPNLVKKAVTNPNGGAVVGYDVDVKPQTFDFSATQHSDANGVPTGASAGYTKDKQLDTGGLGALTYGTPRTDGKSPTPGDMAITERARIYNKVYGTNFSDVGTAQLRELERMRSRAGETKTPSSIHESGQTSAVENSPVLQRYEQIVNEPGGKERVYNAVGSDRYQNYVEAQTPAKIGNVPTDLWASLASEGFGTYGQ